MKVRITESKLRDLVCEVVKEELAGTYGVSDHMDCGEEKLEEVDGYGVSDEIEQPGDMQEAGSGIYTDKLQALVDQANQAYENAKKLTEDDTCLIGTMGGYSDVSTMYGLLSPIVISRGCLIISTVEAYNNTPDVQRIRCFKTVNGKTIKFTDDMAYPEGGYQYAVKCLKGIIRDAQKGIKYNGAIDPNMDDATQEKIGKQYGI